jgi:predicted GIY-YIG superfamily endonuclease
MLIAELLAADKQLAIELEYDFKQLELKEKNDQTNATAPEASPPPKVCPE